jgi:hypothetical protein
MKKPIASISFHRPAPEHWSTSDKGVHEACRGWAVHHASCDHCIQHDWQRPGSPIKVTEDDLHGRRHYATARPSGKTVYYIDEEDSSVLCKTGERLYIRWGLEVMRRVLKVGDG